MATREAMHAWVDRLMDMAEKAGMTVDIMPVQVRNIRVTGRGEKARHVAAMDMAIDPRSFVPEHRDDIKPLVDAAVIGVAVAIPTKYLAGHDDSSKAPSTPEG